MFFETALDSEVKEWVERQVKLRKQLFEECLNNAGEKVVSADSLKSTMIYEPANLIRISRVMGVEVKIEEKDADEIFEAIGRILIEDVEFYSYFRKDEKEKWVKH